MPYECRSFWATEWCPPSAGSRRREAPVHRFLHRRSAGNSRSRLQAINLRNARGHRREFNGRKLAWSSPMLPETSSPPPAPAGFADRARRRTRTDPGAETRAQRPLEVIVPASFRQLPWPELHARLRQHPALSDMIRRRHQVKVDGHSALERMEPADLRIAAEGEEEAVLEPIEIKRPIIVVPGLLAPTCGAGRGRDARVRSRPPYTASTARCRLPRSGNWMRRCQGSPWPAPCSRQCTASCSRAAPDGLRGRAAARTAKDPVGFPL